jgi:MFS family permease
LPVTDDSLAQEGGSAQPRAESLTRLIAPIFAGFSLPTIFVFVASGYPSPPWHDVVLSLLLTATGLFMASIQLSIGRLNDNYGRYLKFRQFRAYLTITGIVAIAFALTFLVCSQISGWWIWLPLAVLLLGGIGPGAVMLFVKDIETDPSEPSAGG